MIQKNTLWLFALVALASIAFGQTALADGGIFYPTDRYSNETNQKAFIYYHNQTENLIVQSGFRGNASDFAWVIPTPSKPEVLASKTGLFTTLESLTSTSNDGPDVVYSTATLGLSGAAPKSSVTVVEQKTVDVFDTAVLQATDGTALSKWLSDHGYVFPSDKTDLLKSYTDQGWYFTVAKIQNALTKNETVSSDLTDGTLAPLMLTFQSDTIIYPMKLTKFAFENAMLNNPATVTNHCSGGQCPPLIDSPVTPQMQISLYVVTTSKIDHKLFSTDWANWLSKKDIGNVNSASGVDNLIPNDSHLFLTKLNNSINLSNVDDDFVLTSASDNSVYPVPAYTTVGYWGMAAVTFLVAIIIATLSPMGLLLVLSLVLQQYVIKKKWAFVLCDLYNISMSLLALAVVVGIVFATTGETDSIIGSGTTLGSILGLLVVFGVIVFFVRRMHKKYRTLFNPSVPINLPNK